MKPNKALKYNEYTLQRVKMGRYGGENSPYKVTKHFSLLLDGKLTCSLRLVVTSFFG